MIVKPRLSLMAGPVAMAVLVASAGWVLWSGFERSKVASQSVEHTYGVLIASERFLSTMREMESSLRAYVITHDPSYLGPYEAGLAKQAQMLDNLDQLIRDNAGQKSRLNKIRELTSQRLDVLAKAEQTIKAGGALAVGSIVPLTEGPRLMSELTQEVSRFEEEERRLLVLRSGAAEEAVTWTRGMLILTSSLLAIVLLFAGAAVNRYLRNREADETQQRAAEELLRQVAEQRRLALDAAELGSWDYSVAKDSVIWDERCREILGLAGLGPASFEQALKMVHPEERPTMRGAAERAMSGRADGRFSHEMRVVLRDGTLRWLATFGRVYFGETNGKKQPVRVIGVNSDITERKRVEEALRESEDKLRVALDTGRIGIFNDLVEENKILFDDRAKQLLGFTEKGDIQPGQFFQSVHPEDREKLQIARSQDLRNVDGNPGEIEYRIVHPNGEVRWLVARRRVYFSGEGEKRHAVRVLGVLLDITEQKCAEQKLTEALLESDRKRRQLSAILQTMPAAVVLADRDNNLVEGNAEAVHIWRAGNLASLAERWHELKGWRGDSEERLPLDEWPRMRALRGETVLAEIIDIERFDGHRRTMLNSASPVRDAHGAILGAVGVMVDITEQRQNELALRRSEESLRVAHHDLERLLEQKNVLFQEVQHRVKNNLQIVSSLLSLEAQRFQDSDFHNALNESRDRIRSMALMHEKFYHLDDLARIDFAEYVEELARYFFSSYIAEPSAVGFSSNVDVKLRMAEAMPCGLILQELLSNSVKHAFPSGKGDIAIDFHSENGKSCLCYRDSGVGLPPSVNLKNPSSLGLQLVSDLAGQLQGTIEYEYRQGAQFTLIFG